MAQRIEKLNSRHFKILECVLRGWTREQIAEHLGVSKQMVSIVTQSDVFQHQLAKRRERYDEAVDQQVAYDGKVVDDAIKNHALAAAEKLGYIVNYGKDADAIRASAEILDRGGHPRTQRMESRSVNLTINAEDALLIRETMEMDR